jgi:hypothetical protein
MRALRVMALLGIASVAARPAAAQVSFDVGGLYVSLGGNDFQGVNAGIGGEAQIRFPLGHSFSFGGGAQYTTHSVDGIDPNFNVWGILAEPRYELAVTGSPVKPYLGARFVYLHSSISSGGNSLTANGFVFAGGGGLMIGAGTVNLDVGVLFGIANFSEQQLNGSGTGFSPNGSAIALRAGIAFGGK